MSMYDDQQVYMKGLISFILKMDDCFIFFLWSNDPLVVNCGPFFKFIHEFFQPDWFTEIIIHAC
jgi:hypothetical protein